MKRLTIAVSALALAACSSGPDYVRPATASTAAGPFVAANNPSVQALAPVPDDWWRLYNDPVLDSLIADALAHNTDVRAAVARLAQARAALREIKVDRLPQGGVNAGVTHGRDVTESDASTSFDAGLQVAYEVDLFGRVRRNVEAGRADVGAADADADAVRIAIVSDTARAYADAASAAERLAVGQRIVSLLDESLRLTKKQVDIGQTTRLDTARIAALRNQRQAELPTIAAERDSALFRLAVLTGRAPAELPVNAGARTSSLDLAHPIPVGDGAQLLARRPDVRAAERRLAGATARIGVATAELYPQVTLGGSVGSSAGSLGNLFSNPIGFLLGPLISWSFSDHARARARVAGAEAGTQEALAQFDGTVMRSLQETETALSAYANALRRREALKAARDEAEIAANIVRAQQREGQVDSLALLDAERTFAEAQAQVADINGQVADAQIDLFRALGGGWQASPRAG
ncbi:efflux transporter outer membrane subunit [Sphingomonas sp. SM33]|uniref:Efflux transporter outer membrane subunit n=1 Tax=Sphingomonas telluris TaxID=2907998 RepID=A0ABS9VR69_9SPHN|nr:efflux transporter outer membrane subunit [Sphingomonas telluris]MCH8617208.1 efflux transporter outer membrane subunit [Sphingomonas telluris]